MSPESPKRGDKLKWVRALDQRPLAVVDLEHVTIANFGEAAPLAVTLQEVAGVFPIGWFERVVKCQCGSIVAVDEIPCDAPFCILASADTRRMAETGTGSGRSPSSAVPEGQTPK